MNLSIFHLHARAGGAVFSRQVNALMRIGERDMLFCGNKARAALLWADYGPVSCLWEALPAESRGSAD